MTYLELLKYCAKSDNLYQEVQIWNGERFIEIKEDEEEDLIIKGAENVN